MESNRRDFLKLAGLAGAGFVTGGSRQADSEQPFQQTHRQQFNMRGYAASALDVVRIGVIGVGSRGFGTVRRLAKIEGVDIKALCDLEPERVSAAIESISSYSHNPDSYSGGEEEWKKLCERDDIDLIYTATPWDLHTPICVYAMEHDKHAYTELPAASSIEECWQLVETSERKRKHCIQMASNCHDGIKAVILNMARDGFFGELIHAEGAYIHDLLMNYNFDPTQYHNMWRLKENASRNGNLYPQHGLLPIVHMMDLNSGDQMDYMTSISSNDFMMEETAERLAAEDDFWEPYVGHEYRGNINTSIIRTKKGRTIMLQHDVTTPRPGVRFDLLSGTKGIYTARPHKIATSHDGWLSEEEFNSLVKKYTPEITKRFNEMVSRAGGFGERGYSRINAMDWRLIDCLRNGLPIEMDVYDAVLTSAVTPLSEYSVANRGASVNVPDFTAGAWKTNKRGMGVELESGGGTTRII